MSAFFIIIGCMSVLRIWYMYQKYMYDSCVELKSSQKYATHLSMYCKFICFFIARRQDKSDLLKNMV